MDDDLKAFNVKYLCNHLLDPTQILHLSLDDQIILYTFFKWRWPAMEDNLNLRNCILDQTQNWNWDLGNQIKVTNISNHLLDPTQILEIA